MVKTLTVISKSLALLYAAAADNLLKNYLVLLDLMFLIRLSGNGLQPGHSKDQVVNKACGQQVWARGTVGLPNVNRAVKPLSWSQGIQTTLCALPSSKCTQAIASAS